MIGAELRTILAELGLSQADFARLINVTSRAVALWTSDGRPVPGVAEAYLRTLRLMPPNLRQIEFGRLKSRSTPMRDGMYGITFQGQQGAGMGVLVFEEGRVYGADAQGVKYDGEYIFNANPNRVDVKLKVTFPPQVPAVFGISNPYEWAFDVTASLDPHANSGRLTVQTSIGQRLDAQYLYLRPLPDAA